MRVALFAGIAATAATLLAFAPVRSAAAQGRWREIGKTSTGNAVFVDTRSVKKANGIVNAVVRAKFADPVKTPEGAWTSSRTSAMFDCAKKTIAVKESTYYIDEARNRVAERRVNKIPGFGPALKGTLADVALSYFCP